MYYNDGPFVFQPWGWDAGWRRAKGTAASTPARMASVGDSISVGATLSGAQTSYFEQLVTYFKGVYGTFADYYASYSGGDNLNPWTSATGGNPIAAPWNGAQFSTSTSAAAYQTFTAPYASTRVDFYYQAPSSPAGHWGWSIDGAANTQRANEADGKVHLLSNTGLSNTAHTFAWGWQDTANVVYTLGCAVYKPSATGGISAARFAGDGLLTTRESNPETYAGLGAANLVSGFPMGADLLVHELEVNDISNGTTVANYAATVDQTIRAFRRLQADCSVILLCPSYPNSVTDDVSTGLGNQASAYQYIQQLYELARVHNCALLNVHAAWGATPFGQGYMPNNSIHPVYAGHQWMYNALLPMLV